MLAVTGALYLWKNQFEEWRYRELFNVPVGPHQHPADHQLAVARAAHPAWSAQQFFPAAGEGRSAEVLMVDETGQKHSVYVDPYKVAIVGELAERDRFMANLHDVHDSFLLGKGTWGEIIIETAASWTIVLLVTGFYLWWPRPFTLRGFLLPRLGAGRRALLRDLHAVPAIWLSGMTLFLLTTGLPWSSISGKWFSTLAKGVGEWQPRETSASAHRSEILGGWSPFLKDKALAEKVAAVSSNVEDEHAMHRKGAPPPSYKIDPEHPPIPLARVIEIAKERAVTTGYGVVLPASATGVYSVITKSDDAFAAAYIHLDQYSGAVLADVRFKDFGLFAKFFAIGKSVHMGVAFGLLNRILGTIACAGILLLVVTGVAMWWSRRPPGKFAAPAPMSGVVLPGMGIGAGVILAALLPLLAASLAAIILLDFTAGRAARWLHPAQSERL